MIPQQETTFSDDLQIETMPSKTYKINFESGRIEGEIDHTEAVKQAVDIILETPKYEETTLPDWYGNELLALVGQDRFYIESEAERMIKDALLTDDRIKGIKEFTILDGEERDSLILRFTAVTIFGNVEIEKVIGR